MKLAPSHMEEMEVVLEIQLHFDLMWPSDKFPDSFFHLNLSVWQDHQDIFTITTPLCNIPRS